MMRLASSWRIGAFALILAATGCSRHEPEEGQEREQPAPTPPTPARALPIAKSKPKAAKPAPEVDAAAPIDEGVQMQEDAEATGMTSRLPPPSDEPPLDNAATP